MSLKTQRLYSDAIAQLDAAQAALAEAHKPDQIRAIVATAAEMQTRAISQGLGDEVIRQANAIKSGAERKLGGMLKETPKNEGAKGVGESALATDEGTPMLADMGISYDLLPALNP